MKKIVLAILALAALAGCSNNYDARPVEGTDCFQIQDSDHDYKGLGTYCKVDLPAK